MYLKIEHLYKSYGAHPVVFDINLTMDEGEILSLLGPSGCGKTTILRVLAGLVKPNEGRITVDELTFFDGKRELPVEERGIGMVFQDYALWPHMTVAQNIAFGLRLRHQPRRECAQRVEELLELVNLAGMGKRYPYQLSGGQQQRVAVARALATKPRLLLLDEPLSSLDTGLRETMSAELVQLFKQLKITTINVTHDQNEAMSMSDRILVLREGKVEQIGEPSELYLHPANTFVGAFMGPANLLPARLVDVQEDWANLQLNDNSLAHQQVYGMLSQQLCEEQKQQTVHLLCRPSDIRLHVQKEAGESRNTLAGMVTFSSFVGGRWRTLIEVGEQKQSVLAFADTLLKPHDQVWVEFPPERCLVLP